MERALNPVDSVQPRIFRWVCLGKDSAIYPKSEGANIPASIPKDFLAHHVKHLCITGRVASNHLPSILSACTGVIDLALWVRSLDGLITEDREGFRSKLLHALPLQRLFCHSLLLSDLQSHPSSPPPRWFQSLTHLTIYYSGNATIEQHFRVPLLSHLESLTHLCLCRASDTISEESAPLLVLQTRPSLRILMIWVGSKALHQQLSEKPYLDARIVYRRSLAGQSMIFTWENNWEPGNMWSQAEDVVRRRQAVAYPKGIVPYTQLQ
ncbi:hypothetical protein BKA70DRAFT_1245326 [Coprinopsis sp. MPI-PUGE-AT-0042]|nr:hypothetical protein BKA70DRAFT_1245326 [Coprinopsis sp. MPI-PUGE-AT-0042]